MKIGGISRETMLIIGLVGALLSLLAGIAVLFGGSIFGGASRQDRKNSPPPAPGTVDPERHQNVANNAAR